MRSVHVATSIIAAMTVLAISACVSQGVPQTKFGAGGGIEVTDRSLLLDGGAYDGY